MPGPGTQAGAQLQVPEPGAGAQDHYGSMDRHQEVQMEMPAQWGAAEQQQWE